MDGLAPPVLRRTVLESATAEVDGTGVNVAFSIANGIFEDAFSKRIGQFEMCCYFFICKSAHVPRANPPARGCVF